MTFDTYLDDLGAYIQSNGFGTVGTDIFYNEFDAIADNCISITPFTGVERSKIVSGELNPYNPYVSILVRNFDARVALRTATNIYKLLRVVSNQLIGTTKFISIDGKGPPSYVAKSENETHIFAINFSLLIS